MSTHEEDSEATTPYCATLSCSSSSSSSTATNNNNNNNNISSSSCTSSIDGSPAPNGSRSLNLFGNDSGNYSSCSPIDMATTANTQYAHERLDYLVREKDQALFTALQDLSRLRAELVNVGKSEQWYKDELRKQKGAHTEMLERLHFQERKRELENRQLQQECLRLNDKCGALTLEVEVRHDRAMQKFYYEASKVHSMDGDTLKMEEQKALICDQINLIDTLRKQKLQLVEDMKRATDQNTTSVMRLQSTLDTVEIEKATLNRNYHGLLTQFLDLQLCQREFNDRLELEANENEKLNHLIGNLMEQLKLEEVLVASKEKQFRELQKKFLAQAEQGASSGNTNNLSVSLYHEEISSKTNEIVRLKSSLLDLQNELIALADLQSQREHQDRIIDDLNETLQTRLFELDVLKQSDEVKAMQIAELQTNLQQKRLEHEHLLEELQHSQTSLRETQNELIAENNHYATMCAICEKTRFELEMREIELRKMSYSTAGDVKDIAQLRERLLMYLHQTRDLSVRIDELEKQLATKNEERSALLERLRETEKLLNEANELAEATTDDDDDQSDKDDLNDLEKMERVNRQLIAEWKAHQELVKEKNQIIEELQQHNAWKEQTAAEALQEKNKQCAILLEQLGEKSAAIRKLQKILLVKDSQLYKMLRNSPDDNDSEAVIEECRQLKAELHHLKENEQNIASQLATAQQTIVEMREAKGLRGDDLEDPVKLLQFLREHPVMYAILQENIMGRLQIRSLKVDQQIQTDGEGESNTLQLATEQSSTEPHKASELVYLRGEVERLQRQLDDVIREGIEKQEKRVALMHTLLQQQNEREAKLRASHDDWEEMIRALQVSRRLEENTRKEMETQRGEFEKMNVLLATQNEQLRKLQESAIVRQQLNEMGDADRSLYSTAAQQTFQNAQSEVDTAKELIHYLRRFLEADENLAKTPAQQSNSDCIDVSLILSHTNKFSVPDRVRILEEIMEAAVKKLVTTEDHLTKMCAKYEQSQATVQALERQLLQQLDQNQNEQNEAGNDLALAHETQEATYSMYERSSNNTLQPANQLDL